MRFMMIIKGDKNSESGAFPEPALLTAMGRYNEELVKSGVLLSGEGLAPTSLGARVRHQRGAISVVDGPFAESKEIVAGFWTIQARSLDEAVEWAKRVPFEAGPPSEQPGQIEVRPLYETTDFPVGDNETGWREEEDALRAAPPPATPGKQKYFLNFIADARSEAGVLPTNAELAAMGQVMDEMGRAGVLLAGEGLKPTSKGARVIFEDGKRRVIDGPFSEAKELVGGYCIIQVGSKDEAIAWTKRAVTAAGDDAVIEVRRIFGEEDFPADLVAQVPEVFEQERTWREELATR